MLENIKVGKDERKFLIELYNQFGGTDQIAATELKFGEETREDLEALMKISARPTLYGLVKFTAQWVSKTQKAAKFDDEFRACRVAKAFKHKVKLVVDGKEVTQTSNFVKKVTEKATKAAKKAEKARVKRARKARQERKDFVTYEMNDIHARMFEAKRLYSEMKEIAQDLVDEYGIELSEAMRHVRDGGEISLKVWGNLKYMRSNAFDLYKIEVQAAKEFVFIKTYKGKVFTANRLVDLEHIKGKLIVKPRKEADKVVQKLNRIHKKANIVKDRFTARLLASGFEL